MKDRTKLLIAGAGLAAMVGLYQMIKSDHYAYLEYRDFQCSPARQPITIREHNFFYDTDDDGRIDTWSTVEEGCRGRVYQKTEGDLAESMFNNVKRGCETTGKVGGFDCLDFD